MESIGELAQRTGTSRRMLRHWEDQGLLAPAEVDPWTNERRYASAQAGRVRAIAALRTVGFGLGAIRELLEQGLSESRLLELLSEREAELADRIAQDSASLAQVRTRLRSIARERSTIMNTLTLSSLPELELHGVTETFLTYDGITDPSVILVSAGVAGGAPEVVADRIRLPPVDQAAVVQLGIRPTNTADAWIALDAELEVKGLRATGPYRQVLHASGAVTLATPVTAASRCS